MNEMSNSSNLVFVDTNTEKKNLPKKVLMKGK